jgi:hypothetical protein
LPGSSWRVLILQGIREGGAAGRSLKLRGYPLERGGRGQSEHGQRAAAGAYREYVRRIRDVHPGEPP